MNHSWTSLGWGMALAGAVAWIAYGIARRRIIDRRFGCKVSGGRGGVITVRLLGRMARAEYEVGSSVEFIIYRSSLSWSDGSILSQTERSAFIDRLIEWSFARRSKIELTDDTGANTATESAKN